MVSSENRFRIGLAGIPPTIVYGGTSFCHNGTCADNGTIAYGNARHNDRFVPNPNVISDHNSPLLSHAAVIFALSSPHSSKKIGNG